MFRSKNDEMNNNKGRLPVEYFKNMPLYLFRMKPNKVYNNFVDVPSFKKFKSVLPAYQHLQTPDARRNSNFNKNIKKIHLRLKKYYFIFCIHQN